MSARTKALIGVFAWLAFSLPQTPNVHHGIWGHVLVQFAALVIAPFLIEVVRRSGDNAMIAWAARLQLPAALLLVAAFRFENGEMWGIVSAAAWAGVLTMLAVGGLMRVRSGGERSPARWCREGGLVFAAVGAAWLIADRAGMRPLGFSADMVLLTAVHFHYAGLILPVIAGEALAEWRRPLAARVIAGGVLAGVPAVAVGITASQLGWSSSIELAAAFVMAVSGAAVGVVHVALGLGRKAMVSVRCLWVVAGCSLIAGMLLAALYGMRGVFALWPWLDIPWMRALHGTVNALGFGFCGTLAWWRTEK
jgi:hypothetical protein